MKHNTANLVFLDRGAISRIRLNTKQLEKKRSAISSRLERAWKDKTPEGDCRGLTSGGSRASDSSVASQGLAYLPGQ